MKQFSFILHESFSSISENYLMIVKDHIFKANHLIFTAYGICTLHIME